MTYTQFLIIPLYYLKIIFNIINYSFKTCKLSSYVLLKSSAVFNWTKMPVLTFSSFKQVVGGKMTESGRLCAFITKVKKGSLADTVGHLRPGRFRFLIIYT